MILEPLWESLPEAVFINHIAPWLPIDTRISLQIPPKPLVRCKYTDELITISLLNRKKNTLSHGPKTYSYLIPNLYKIFYDYSGIHMVYIWYTQIKKMNQFIFKFQNKSLLLT